MTGHVHDRAEQIVAEIVEMLGQITEHRPPAQSVSAQSRRRGTDRPEQQSGVAGIERVRAVGVGPLPHQPVPLETDLRPERRSHAQRMEGRTVVVDDARDRQFARPGPTTDDLGRLQDLHVDTVARQVQSGGEPVGPAADHDSCGHCGA